MKHVSKSVGGRGGLAQTESEPLKFGNPVMGGGRYTYGHVGTVRSTCEDIHVATWGTVDPPVKSLPSLFACSVCSNLSEQCAL